MRCASAVQVAVVGLGSRQNALSFSKLLDFPLRLLYAGEPPLLPQFYYLELLHKLFSMPASCPIVAAWPVSTVCTIPRTTALVCLCYRDSVSGSSGVAISYRDCDITQYVFALLQIQKEFATRLLASHLDLLLTLRYLRTSSCCPC